MALVFHIASLIRNANIKYKSNLGVAIGIRLPDIQQKSRGFMIGSFNVREYFHGAKLLVFKRIKWVFLLLVFPLPISLLLIGFDVPDIGVFTAAFVIQYMGLITEPCFFFAKANHPQNLYYQSI